MAESETAELTLAAATIKVNGTREHGRDRKRGADAKDGRGEKELHIG